MRVEQWSLTVKLFSGFSAHTFLRQVAWRLEKARPILALCLRKRVVVEIGKLKKEKVEKRFKRRFGGTKPRSEKKWKESLEKGVSLRETA